MMVRLNVYNVPPAKSSDHLDLTDGRKHENAGSAYLGNITAKQQIERSGVSGGEGAGKTEQCCI